MDLRHTLRRITWRDPVRARWVAPTARVKRTLGLALLRTAWVNLDLVWAPALVATAVFTLLL